MEHISFLKNKYINVDRMEVGFIGLGRMGKRMALRLLLKKHEVIAYDIDKKKISEIRSKGCKTANNLKELLELLKPNRTIIIMVPAENVYSIIKKLKPYLSKDDIVIDAGNSYYKNSIKNAKYLASKDVYFLDVGTSGGLKGAEKGASMTVGGKKKAYERVLPILKTLAAEDGILYVGESGAGHFVKMVHNAIEYGILQAYGEGFELLYNAPYKFDLEKIAYNWNHGSIVQSRILELAIKAFENHGEFEKIVGIIEGGQSGGWAIKEAKKQGLSLPTAEVALKLRHKSYKKQSFSSKFVATLRNVFGGHRLHFKKTVDLKDEKCSK